MTKLQSIQALMLTGILAVAPARANIFQATLLEPNQPTQEVSTDELKLILETGSAVVFDARPVEEFAMSHIPGALNVAQKPGTPTAFYISDAKEIGRILSDDTARAIVLYCNGPFCGKSKRLASDLLAAGYTNVRRYQLGMPVWRALVGIAQIEESAIERVYKLDATAVFIDTRSTEEAKGRHLPRARRVPLSEVAAAKEDGRLPMEDHNTRIVVFGVNGAQARRTTAELAKNAFSNVTFYSGTAEQLIDLLTPPPVRREPQP